MGDLSRKRALGPYELPDELFYLTPPVQWRTGIAVRERRSSVDRHVALPATRPSDRTPVPRPMVLQPIGEAGQALGKRKVLVQVSEAIRTRQYSLEPRRPTFSGSSGTSCSTSCVTQPSWERPRSGPTYRTSPCRGR
jgi:hypothetical protein